MTGLLLDTNVLLAIIEERMGLLGRTMQVELRAPRMSLHASVASLWEIAIKVRIGKLPLKGSLAALPELLQSFGLSLLNINTTHVLADLAPMPATRDPFDRLLLGQCSVENLRLMTRDRVLAGHPLAWRPA